MWAFFIIPQALIDHHYRLVGWSAAFMLVLHVALAVLLANSEFPLNVLAGLANFCFPALLGYVAYKFQRRTAAKEQDQQ
jgi:hypothetical protein